MPDEVKNMTLMQNLNSINRYDNVDIETKTTNVFTTTISLARIVVNNKENGGLFMHNMDIREYAKKHGVLLWQIAGKLGISDGNFSRRLRTELAEDKKTEIKAIIDELAAE